MEEHGIGTDATRATYPKLIIERGYGVKRGRKIIPTRLGTSLIEALETYKQLYSKLEGKLWDVARKIVDGWELGEAR